MLQLTKQQKTGSNILNNFEVEFQRDERILRWLTVKLDKFALDYSEKRKNNLKEKEEK